MSDTLPFSVIVPIPTRVIREVSVPLHERADFDLHCQPIYICAIHQPFAHYPFYIGFSGYGSLKGLCVDWST